MLQPTNAKMQKLIQLLQQGQVTPADVLLRDLETQYPDAHLLTFYRAQFHFLTGDFDKSEQALNALALNSQVSPELFDMLARQLNQQEQFFALAQLLKSKSEQTDSPIFAFQYALCLMKIGQIASALAIFKTLQKRQFSHPQLAINTGHAYKALGEIDAAVHAYKTSLKLHPELSGTAWWSLADLKNYIFSDDDRQILASLLQTQSLNDNERGLSQFAQARALEQARRYDESFKAMVSANHIVATLRPFNKNGFDHLKRSLHRTTINSRPPAKSPDKRMIFIVGMPRSGTTLTEQILASHSQVGSTDELPYMERIAMQVCRARSYYEAVSQLDSADCARFAAHYLNQAKRYDQNNSPVLLDKNPNNWMHCALINKLFPDAIIINTSRPASDNLLSIFKQYFSAGQDYSYQLNAIQHYMQGYYEVMSHWKKQSPSNLITLDYQQLISAPESTIRLLLQSCGLEFEPQCLRFYENKRAVLTPSANQVKQPINNKSLNSSTPFKQNLLKQLPLLDELEIQRQAMLAC